MTYADYRITQTTMARRVTANMQSTLRRMNDTQEQISSNRRLNRPSDSPVDTVSSLHLRAQLGRTDQISRNIEDATAWLGTADNTLTAVVDQINQIRDLTLQAQSGALGQTELNAIADQIDEARKNIVALANTRYVDRPIFAGTAQSPEAYDTNGNYVGKSAVIERTVAPGVKVQVNVNGDEVFGAAGNDLFTVIAQIANDVRYAPTALDADLSNLDARTTGVQTKLAEVGARQRRIDAMKDRNDQAGITLKDSLSGVEDIDLPKAIMEMQMQQVAYQAAIQTTARVIQPSLVDFLR